MHVITRSLWISGTPQRRPLALARDTLRRRPQTAASKPLHYTTQVFKCSMASCIVSPAYSLSVPVLFGMGDIQIPSSSMSAYLYRTVLLTAHARQPVEKEVIRLLDDDGVGRPWHYPSKISQTCLRRAGAAIFHRGLKL